MFLLYPGSDMTKPDTPPPHSCAAAGTFPVYAGGGLAENGPARLEETRN
jgi:hypothetical protein